MSEIPVLQTRDGAVLRLTINRPQQLNALNGAVLDALEQAFAAAAGERALRAIVVTGAGERAFIAGADIKEMADHGPREAEALSRRTHRLHETLRACPQPIVAAINGHCLGGGLELALACDLRFAADSARLGLPEVTLGILPGGGGTVRLARLCGVAAAKRLALTGEVVTAADALNLGVVDAVFPAADFAGKVDERVQRLAAMSPAALARIKRLFDGLLEGPAGGEREQEILSFAQCFTTADQREGMAAFAAKRPPRFTGD